MEFSQILGNDPIKTHLQRSIENKKLNNTLLFFGPDGIGKSLFAKAIAKDLMLSDPHRIDNENHPDYYVFYPEQTSAMHSIEKIRFLIEEVYKPPFEAASKVFVIHDAESMLPSSANALLKTLEEPTLDSTIILLVSNKQALLPTILSRCMTFSFMPLLEEQIKKYLLDNFQIDHEMAHKASKRAEGSLGAAILLVQDEAYKEKETLLLTILQDSASLLESADKIQSLIDEEKKEKTFQKKHVDLLLAQILLWQRDCYHVRYGKDLFFPEYKEIIEFQSASVPSFDKIKKSLTNLEFALERNVKLSSCLINFFLELQQTDIVKV